MSKVRLLPHRMDVFCRWAFKELVNQDKLPHHTETTRKTCRDHRISIALWQDGVRDFDVDQAARIYLFLERHGTRVDLCPSIPAPRKRWATGIHRAFEEETL